MGLRGCGGASEPTETVLSPRRSARSKASAIEPTRPAGTPTEASRAVHASTVSTASADQNLHQVSPVPHPAPLLANRTSAAGRDAQDCGQFPELPVIATADGEMPIFGGQSFVGSDGRMPRLHAHRCVCGRQVGRGLVGQRPQEAGQQVDLDPLPGSIGLSGSQRRQDADDRIPLLTSNSATPTFIGSPGVPVMLIRPPTAWTRKSYPGRSFPARLPNPVIEAYTTRGLSAATWS